MKRPTYLRKDGKPVSLPKHQTKGGTWGTPEQMYNDSLNLYNAYQFQKKNIKPHQNNFFNTNKFKKDNPTGKIYPKGKEWDWKNRIGDDYSTIEALEKAYPGENNKKIADYYKTLKFNAPTYIGLHSSPDLFHKNISPIATYYDGNAYSPVYKKPVYNPSKQTPKTLPNKQSNKEPIYVDDKNDPRYKAYTDSLLLSKQIIPDPKYILTRKKIYRSDPEVSGFRYEKNEPKPIYYDRYEIPDGEINYVARYKKPVQEVRVKEKSKEQPKEKAEYMEMRQASMPTMSPEEMTVKGKIKVPLTYIKQGFDPVTKKYYPYLVEDINAPAEQGRRIYNREFPPSGRTSVPDYFVPQFEPTEDEIYNYWEATNKNKDVVKKKKTGGSLDKYQKTGPIYLPSINYVFPGQYIPNYLQHKVFETEEDFNKDRLLQIRNNYWPTKNNRVFDAGFDILNSRLGPRPVRMPSITSDYRGVAMMYGGTINKYQTKGGNESKLRLPAFSVEDDIQTSFYDPITERITLKYPVRPETLKHEMFHHFQNMKDYLRMFEDFPSMKKPQIPASEELYHAYMNRKANDIKTLLQEFRKKSPEFEMVPDELIYRRHPYLEAKQYWIPNTVEGEADLAEYDPKALANTPNMYSDKGYNMSEFDDLVKRFYQKYYPNIVKSKIKNQGLKTSKHQKKGEVAEEPKLVQGYRLPEVTITDEQPGFLDRLTSRLQNTDFVKQLTNRIAESTGGKDWYKDPTKGFGSALVEVAMLPFSTPQLAATYGVTGKVQTPSEAMNIQNPYAAFAIDAVLDPTNLVGAGIADDALKLSSKARNFLKRGSKIIDTPTQLPGSPNSIENLASVVSTPKTGAWQMEELPGLHLKSTMSDGAISKIVEPKTGLVNTEQALGIIAKESGGKEKVELIKQAFGENIPKKIDYNEFRKVVQNQLVPLEKQIVSSNSNYGINRLGYLSPKKSSYDQAIKTTKDAIARGENVTENTAHLEGLLKEYEQLPLENQTLVLSNKNKFGRGSSAHDNPDETLGHIHFLRDAESPDVLTVTQIQSDAFQGTHRIMPKNKEQAMKSLESMQKHADMLDDYYSKAEPVLSSEKFGRPGEYRWYKLPDGRTVSKEIIEEGSKKQRYLNELSKNELENFSQKQLLDKHHQERYIQELVQYAGERGDINKLRLPTSETAAKVQGYSKNTATGMDEMGLPTDLGYSSEHQTILKKYSEQPKTIKKLFGVEPKIVTDGKGNTWYEFDIPKSFKEGKGELKAFRVGGSTGEKEKRNSNWNTFKKSLAEDMSQQGYRRTSKYKNLPFIVINNGDKDIDMTETDFPIYAISNKGEERIMEPGTIQKFEGDQVLEIPMHQTEGAVSKPPVYSGNPNDKEALRKWAEEYVAWEQGQKDNMRTWAEQQVQREMTTAPQLTATTYTENIRPKKAVAENKDTFKVVREKTQDNRSINKSINDSKIPVSTKKEKTPLITAEELRSETTQMFRPSVDPFKRDQTLQSSSNQGFETENENINVENVGEESLWESAKRFIGSWLPEDQKGTVKVKPEFKTKSSLLKRIEEQELGKNPVNIKNDDFGYKEYGESSDVGKNKLAIFTHGFDNDSGAKYKVGHMVLELKNPKNPKKFSGVKAVAHFIRNGDILPFTNPEFGKSYKTKSGFEMKSTSTGKYLSSPADQTPEDYVMLYRKDKDDNTFTIKYKKQKDLTTDDIRNYPDSYDKQNKRFDLNVKSYRFADVDWDAEGKRAPGFGTGIKFIPLKKGSPSTQRNRTTSLPYNSKNVFSRFSGASVIFVFKDPKTGKSIGIDAAGSIEFLKETGNGIINKYKINPEELDVLHHDLGSYSAKPKAKNNVLDYSQWMNFNTIDKGKSGAPIMIVDEEVPNPPARQLNQKKSGGSVTKNMSKITYLSKTGKLVSK